jgi:hypothetical protein
MSIAAIAGFNAGIDLSAVHVMTECAATASVLHANASPSSGELADGAPPVVMPSGNVSTTVTKPSDAREPMLLSTSVY